MIFVTASIVSSVISVTAKIVNVTIGGSTGGTINVYLDGALNQSVTTANFATEIVNISL